MASRNLAESKREERATFSKWWRGSRWPKTSLTTVSVSAEFSSRRHRQTQSFRSQKWGGLEREREILEVVSQDLVVRQRQNRRMK
ncbi:hypothetical protein GBA52_015277 [Prunus armeniaca]|nr:hypothetical protein GBA52_015277 [Prunus armeniaca]